MKTLAPLLLIVGASFWGLSWLPLHYLASAGLQGMPLVLIAYGLIGALALPILWAQRRAWWPQRNRLLVIALCGGWGTAALVSALANGEVVRVMLLFYLAPVWSTLGGWVFLRERLGWQRWVALLLAMAGIALTLGLSRETFKPLNSADWLALSAGLGFSLNNLATRAADQVPLASKTLATYVGSAVLALLCCLLLVQPVPTLNPTMLALAGLLGFGWLLALTAVQYGVSHIEAGRAAVLVVVELLVAVLSSAWLGEHAISLQEWLGAGLITGAALLAGWPESKPTGAATRLTAHRAATAKDL